MSFKSYLYRQEVSLNRKSNKLFTRSMACLTTRYTVHPNLFWRAINERKNYRNNSANYCDIDLIKDIEKSSNEYYFVYKTRSFSIAYLSNDTYGLRYRLYAYPKWIGDLQALVALSAVDWDSTRYVNLTEDATNTREEREILKALFTSIQSKFFGVEDFLDNILATA